MPRASVRPLRRRLRQALGVAAALVAIAGGGVGGAAVLLGRQPVEEVGFTGPATLPVAAVAAVEESGYTVSRRFTGRVVAGRIAAPGFERGGLVEAVLVDDGDRVDVGDPLARLDTRLLGAERARLVAELARVAANLELAQATASRRARLARAGHSSEQAYDEARFAVAAFEAEQDGVAAAIAAIDVDLDKSLLTAPFAGRITGRQIDEGTVVAAGQALMQVVEDQRPEVRVAVPVVFAGDLAAGDRVRLTLLGREQDGTVTAVLPDLERATRTVTVVVAPQEPVAVPSGEIASMAIDQRVASRGRWVPLAALSEGLRGLWTVYVLEPARSQDAGIADPGYPLYVVRRAAVEVLQPEEDRAFVRGALDHEALIVADGPHRVLPGQFVHLAPASARQAAR